MRIVSWNCYRGECRERAQELDALNPDLIILQECGQPDSPQDERCRWFGNRPIQGVGVLGRGEWTIEPCAISADVPDSAYPVRAVGPTTLNVLAMWTQQRPTYVRSALTALELYRDHLMSGPSIVVGDFNSHWRWDSSSATANHSRLVEVLRDDFGLVSAYHAFTGRPPGDEVPTLYWQWKQHQTYHVDYCFVPEAWLPRIRSVEVGGWSEWEGRSDHRPLVIDIEDERPSS